MPPPNAPRGSQGCDLAQAARAVPRENDDVLNFHGFPEVLSTYVGVRQVHAFVCLLLKTWCNDSLSQWRSGDGFCHPWVGHCTFCLLSPTKYQSADVIQSSSQDSACDGTWLSLRDLHQLPAPWHPWKAGGKFSLNTDFTEVGRV